jgi:protein-S-isoprenylcysteine O-methyltransferase Ste14
LPPQKPSTPPASPPHAGVHIPPPLVYAIAFLVAYFVHRAHPLLLAGSGHAALLRLVDATGLALLIVWGLLAFSAMATFYRARTTIVPNRPASTLVTSGPYRLTRNPMYVSLTALYLALTLLLDSWWPLMLLPIVLLIIDRAIITREERYLAAAFPADYDTYRARVRRWL